MPKVGRFLRNRRLRTDGSENRPYLESANYAIGSKSFLFRVVGNLASLVVIFDLPEVSRKIYSSHVGDIVERR